MEAEEVGAVKELVEGEKLVFLSVIGVWQRVKQRKAARPLREIKKGFNQAVCSVVSGTSLPVAAALCQPHFLSSSCMFHTSASILSFRHAHVILCWASTLTH